MPEPRKGWSDRLFETVKHWSDYAFNWMIDHIPILRPLTFAKGLGFLTPEEEKVRNPLFDEIATIPGLTEANKAAIRFVGDFAARTDVPVNEIVGVLAFQQVLAGYNSPIGLHAAFHMAKQLQVARPDPTTAWLMHFRCNVPRDAILSWLHDMGWSTELIDWYRKVAETLLGAGEILELYRRGEHGLAAFQDALHKLGYSAEDTASLEKLAARIPGPSDLVTFALREVWRTDLRPELLSPNAPGEYYDWMAKQGFSRHFAENYWASHWVLPSVRQGFEMFWRIPEFTEGDLRSLLTRLDILPRYHDNLLAIAYAPWTRVDIRRMHKLGVIPDRAGLERAYGDIGYHGAQLSGIVDFTIAYNAEEERDYTRTDILAAYEMGRFNRSEALGALVSIGYSELLADVWLSKADLSRANKYARERIAQVKTLFRGKRITRTEAHTQLTSIPIPSAEADAYLELWDVTREALVGRPSKSELRRFFLQNILEESEFRGELAGHHLSDTYINWYVDDAKIHLAEAMMKEVERTQKEEERVRKSKVTSDRDKALAKLDVLIAEANVSIADIKLSMIPEMPEEEVAQAKELILAFKALIAQLREQKALVRVGYYEEIRPEE